MLSLVNVVKIFPSGDGVITAVDNVSLHVSSGEFVALVGRSGSGKTTLLNLIGGLDVPDSGTVSVNGIDISRMKEKKLTLFRRKNIGCVFQFFNLVPELTAWENILFPAQLAGIKPDTDRMNSIVSLLGIGDRLSHTPSGLSGGEQQRVAIARALVTSPALLLLDEPTGNLDSRSSEAVISMLCDLKEATGQTVIMVTHDSGIAARAGRTVTLCDGRIISDTGTED